MVIIATEMDFIHQIIASLTAILKLLPQNCNLTVNYIPRKTTVKRYFVTMAIMVTIHASRLFKNAGPLQSSVDETPFMATHLWYQ